MPVFKIHHITRYQYDRPVKESVSQVRIYPLEDPGQHLRQFDLHISGDPEVAVFSDFYGNKVGDFSLLQPHQELVIDSRFAIQTSVRDEAAFHSTMKVDQLQPLMEKDINLLRLREPERIGEQWVIDNILKDLKLQDKSISEMVWACSEFIYCNFRYEKGITSVETTVDEILHHRSGVCQDFAHVCLQLLRTLGIPA
ncbi:MAG TPA: transglutaminase N-terminal domain-containing protein, partial [Phnomibacter sp.]|nr:transglutaminase N-terminal domain-containing protein [Phnomibacter sp.]